MGSLEYSELDSYGVVQVSLTCLSGVDRKMLIPAKQLQDILRGKESLAFEGGAIPSDCFIFDIMSSMGVVRIDPETLRPIPWLTRDGHRVGGVFCEVAQPTDKSGHEVSPRSVAIRQVRRLNDIFNLTIKSAIEAELMIFQRDKTTPFNNMWQEAYGRYDNMAGIEHSLLGTCHLLEEAGLPLDTFMSELAASQFELTFQPQEGVASADTIILMKDCLRVNLSKHSLVPTFMTIPNELGHANGFHFNHSLWTPDGLNLFIDAHDPSVMSATTGHWIAGLVHHAPALTALFCPTFNCFRRLANEMTPKTATWGEENRSCFLRVKMERGNIYVENRLPSSASNPYLTLAATLAAGMDGLERKLTCPPQNDATAPAIPRSLEEAVVALENDHVLVKALGEEFVQAFLELTTKSLRGKVEHQLEDLDQQRNIYFLRI